LGLFLFLLFPRMHQVSQHVGMLPVCTTSPNMCACSLDASHLPHVGMFSGCIASPTCGNVLWMHRITPKSHKQRRNLTAKSTGFTGSLSIQRKRETQREEEGDTERGREEERDTERRRERCVCVCVCD